MDLGIYHGCLCHGCNSAESNQNNYPATIESLEMIKVSVGKLVNINANDIGYMIEIVADQVVQHHEICGQHNMPWEQ